MNLDLVVSIDAAGMYHVARTVSKPAHHRGGRTIPGGVTVTGFCVRATGARLDPPDHHVDLAVRGEGSSWCPECAGYLDHLEMTREAEASGGLVPIKSPLLQQIDDMRARFAEANAEEMARLGEALTGVDQSDELAARRAALAAGVHPLGPIAGYEHRSPVLDALGAYDDELAAKRELRRLAAEGETE